jgi:hypothetical protein
MLQVDLFTFCLYPYSFFLFRLSLLSLHQVLVWNIEHGIDVFAANCDWVKGSALWFDWGFEEGDVVGFE